MTKKDLPKMDDFDDFEVPMEGNSISDAKSYFESYKKLVDILGKLPTKELIKRGWLKSENDMSSLSNLFLDIHSNRLSGLFRKSDTANEAMCAIWQSHIAATAKLIVASGNIEEFNGIQADELKEFAKLSVNEEEINNLPSRLGQKGIVLVYEQGLPAMKLDGLVFKLESGHPVIGMSFRYPRLDNFWFTLLHELSHIFLHFDKLDDPIFDDLDIDSREEIEIEANRLTKDSFVERKYWRNCKPKYERTEESVVAFANDMGIHPAIVAGMLQREENKYDIYRKLVDKVNVRELVFNNG